MDKIIILLISNKFIFSRNTEFKLVCKLSIINKSINLDIKNYIRQYLDNYNYDSKDYNNLDIFYLNLLIKYNKDSDAIIIKKLTKKQNINYLMLKRSERILEKNPIYFEYIQNNTMNIYYFQLIKILFDYITNNQDLEKLRVLQLLSITNNIHKEYIIHHVNDYVKYLNYSNMSNYSVKILKHYIIYSKLNNAYQIYTLYNNRTLSSDIRQLCMKTIQYKYGKYLTINYGIIVC